MTFVVPPYAVGFGVPGHTIARQAGMPGPLGVIRARRVRRNSWISML
ncbi:hypothetical protein ACFU9X_43765 [Streptomyces atratus]